MQPRLIGLLLLLLAGYLQTLKHIKDDTNCVLYLGFDRYNSENLHDDSPYKNRATLANGASISKIDGSCGVCVQLLGGEVIIDGKNFEGIPETAITIALMVNLVNVLGSHQLFQTVGNQPNQQEDKYQYQYNLECIDGRVRWFHRNDKGETVFAAITSEMVLKTNIWVEIAVMYDVLKGRARIYVDGELKQEELSDPMRLSQDWSIFAGIGKFKGDRELKGYVDEFYIFNRTLTEDELKQLHNRCKGPKASQILHLAFENTTSENDTTVEDTSLQGNDGSFIGALVPGVNGTCGSGIKIPGNDSAELSVNGPAFRNKPTDAVAIAMWVKLDDNSGLHRLFYTIGGHSMHTHEQYDLSAIGGALRWVQHNEYDQEIFSVKTQPVIIKGIWTHVAVTYDSSKEIAIIYVNGDIKEGANGAGALSEDWDGIAAFGKHNTSESTYDWFDEIYVFDRELSPLEIRTMYTRCSYILNYGLEIANQSMLIYFTFDRISGDSVYDDSGYQNDGELVKKAGLAKDAGKCGHGLRTQGGNILVNGEAIKNKPKDGITIAVWIYVDTTEGQQEIFQTIDPKAKVNKHGQFYLELSDGQVRWFHRNIEGETIFSAETPKPVVVPETWAHIGVTYDCSKKKAIIYVNGEIAQEDSGSGQMSQDWSGRVSIGKFYDTSDSGEWLEGRYFYGMIDEFYLYNRALSKVEINALSQVCDFRRIVLYFGFTKIEGTRIYDQSGIANNGVFQNGTQLINGVCGRAVNFSNQGHIVLNGGQFRQKPLNGISISAWIWLNTNRGSHQLFNTIGSHSMHTHDQYYFSIENGKILWSHNDQVEKEVFKSSTLAIVKPRQWCNIIVSYDSQESKAKTFLNGQLVKEAPGSGYLSQDWGHFAGIGMHYRTKKYLSGAIDEYSMYNYALPDDEVQYIAKGECVR